MMKRLQRLISQSAERITSLYFCTILIHHLDWVLSMTVGGAIVNKHFSQLFKCTARKIMFNKSETLFAVECLHRKYWNYIQDILTVNKT